MVYKSGGGNPARVSAGIKHHVCALTTLLQPLYLPLFLFGTTFTWLRVLCEQHSNANIKKLSEKGKNVRGSCARLGQQRTLYLRLFHTILLASLINSRSGTGVTLFCHSLPRRVFHNKTVNCARPAGHSAGSFRKHASALSVRRARP